MSFFITLEGPEGAGKSTLIAALSRKLQEAAKEVVITREPGGTELGKKIRNLLLDAKDSAPDSLTELLLFAADRAEHVNKVIKPALAAGKVVVCDRFIHSTLAYQGYGRGINLELVKSVNKIAIAGLSPHLVILLDIDIAKGLSRAKGRSRDSKDSESWNRFEQQELDFHKKVRAGFLEMAKDPSNNFLVIDASHSIDAVSELAWQGVETLLDSSTNKGN